MAYIQYVSQEDIPEANRVNDFDNIVQIHGIHSEVMKRQSDLYLTLMRKQSPLSRIQREAIAVTVSSINECHY